VRPSDAGVVDTPPDDLAAAIARLPVAYAVALRMQRSGATDHDIARALGLADVDTARTTLALAQVKLDEELRRSSGL
jgi:DNA-directed RNA polymerase specialized sigma24 family protein